MENNLLLSVVRHLKVMLKFRRFGLKLIFIVMTVVAIGSYLFRPPIIRASVSVDSLRLSPIDGGELLLATCNVTNTAPNSLWFVAIDGEPTYDYRIPIGGRWEDRTHYWCSQQRVTELQAGESIGFEAVGYSPDGMQIGIGFSTSPEFEEVAVVWSNRKLTNPSTN